MSAWKPIAQIAEDVHAGRVKASDLVEQSLSAIGQHQEFNAIIATLADAARSRAKLIDQKVADGDKLGVLAGVPFVAKDNFLVFGSETTAASNMLRGFTAPYQATAVERLEAAGAICVAKANLDAFAHGSSTENSDFFTTLNPRDKTRVPGGSSGGSAASVVLELASFALGTDTGGSIRLPASFTGCVGYKPTYGLVSRSGVVAMASSLDVVGPLTTTVQDAALVLDVLAGKDPLDATTIERDPHGYTLPTANTKLSSCKIGVITEYMGEGLNPGVRAQITQAIDRLKQRGATITELSLPSLPLGLAVYYVLCPAEVSSNLSRYDGQRYGHTAPSATDLTASYTDARQTGFGREAKRRIMMGTYVLSSGYYDAYYKKAQTVRTKVIDEFAAAFGEVDYLLGPTAPMTAFALGANTHDPLQMYLSDIMTVAANLAGLPAVSVPCGLSAGLPVGLQLFAPQKHDRELLALANTVEKELAS
jgi:aspartyl-tRNA(Asn)/glutamyl-tRNA(Gln) amidotransferase subunit A